MAPKKSTSKKSTAAALADIQKGLADIQKQAKGAVKKIAPKAEQAIAATELAKNTIQGLTAETKRNDPNQLQFGQKAPEGITRKTKDLSRTSGRDTGTYTTAMGQRISAPKDFGTAEDISVVDTTTTGGDVTGDGTGGVGSGADRVYTAPDGTTFTDQQAFAAYTADLRQQKFDEANKLGERKSAFSILKEEFDRYGLGDLVGDVEQLAKEGLSAAEYSLELRKKPSYTQRFSANQQRINSGLRALSEAEYVSLEDQYQQVMRQYGLPQSFYSTGKLGRQPELEKFIAGDVSPVELEDRVQTAVERVKNAAPEVIQALTTYYGGPGGITESNLVSYVLDPQRALPEIKRKVAAAEIGAAGKVAGFGVTGTRAEELAMRGITQAQAQQGYQTAAEITPRAGQLASIYGGEQYDQTAAEQEVFGLEGAASARRKRQRLAGLERGQFSQQTGMSGTALERNRSGAF
jgi:hypothetical protein